MVISSMSVDIFEALKRVLSIIFLASKSSLTVSPYQLIFPENLPFKLLLRRLNNSVCVRSFFRRADKIAFLSVSYFFLSIFFPAFTQRVFRQYFFGGHFPSSFLILLFALTFISGTLTKHAFGTALVNSGISPS